MHPIFRRGRLTALVLALAAPVAQAQALADLADPFASIVSPTAAASGATCVSTGIVTVRSTIRVTNTNWDGGCKTYQATSALGDGSQKEDQLPVFRVENGTLRNVIIGSNGADGIHVHGNGTLDNIRWNDVGEDAMTIKEPGGTVTLRNISAFDAADKVFQANHPSTLNISNCRIQGALKVYRQLGGSTFKTAVTLTGCDLANVREAVFRTDGANSTARWVNGRAAAVKLLCEGYAAGKCTKTGVAGL